MEEGGQGNALELVGEGDDAFLRQLSKEELIALILEERGRRKCPTAPKEAVIPKHTKKAKIQRKFCMDHYHQRHIALKIVYFGWNNGKALKMWSVKAAHLLPDENTFYWYYYYF